MAETPKDTQEALEHAGKLQERDRLYAERQKKQAELEQIDSNLRNLGFEPESEQARRRNVIPDQQ